MRALTEALGVWFGPRRRAYPWRGSRDPYAVLVSEVMLQQTQAPRVAPAFERFLARFPTVDSLARAPRSDVVRAWAGLGYNRRAVALSESARAIVARHGGRVPRDPDALRRLPGVGPYTSAAVASLAFGMPVAAVDTNVRRVVARAALGREADDVSSAAVLEAATGWVDRDEPAEWNQAVMDLGREVCRPRPRCEACPIAGWCRFRSAGSTAKRGRRSAGRSRRTQEPFDGSSRQIRGAVVRALLERESATLRVLADETGLGSHLLRDAVEGLVGDGLVRAGPAALAGRAGGRVRLAG